MKPPCQVIDEQNVSHAWARAMLKVMEPGECGPLTVSVTGINGDIVTEDPIIRQTLDKELIKQKKCSVCDTASTIFPYSCWVRRKGRPRSEFFDWYTEKLYPRLVSRNSANKYGIYFHRMINFTGAKLAKGKDPSLSVVPCNQLDYVIDVQSSARQRGTSFRQSGLQITCLDPAKDNNRMPQRGFPCLQQVGFTHEKDELGIHAFYPTESIFDRGYGNYLGLIHLGIFAAHELNMKMTRLNCYIGHPLCSTKVNKTALKPLANIIQGLLPPKNQ